MERQKFPFTIENILSKYPNSNGDRRTCGTSGAGLKEKAVSPVGDQTETVHHACLCCCYCSHCGDIFRSDYIPEGKTKPSAPLARFKNWFCYQYHLYTPCLQSSNQISSLQPVNTDGPRWCSQTHAGQEKLAEMSSHPVRCRGGPDVTALFSQRSSWTHWRSCSCRTSTQM